MAGGFQGCLECKGMQLSSDGLRTQGVGWVALLELLAVGCFAALPSFVNAFPAAEIGSGFGEIVVARQLPRVQGVVKSWLRMPYFSS